MGSSRQLRFNAIAWRTWSAYFAYFFFLPLSAANSDLAVVRAFASDKEVAEMAQIFQLWTAVPPCDAQRPPSVGVDVILVYSQSFEANPTALQATQNVIASFESTTNSPPWRQCFQSMRSFDAKLSTSEDIYDARGYAARNDWANGPNSVFLYVMRSFKDGTFGNYQAFFFMEFDAVPVRGNWLQQFVAEAYDETVAIRGSRYRGDTWDPYLSKLPADLLFHVNGNAIYNLGHPWLTSMVQQLETELQAGQLSSAFDVRMAQLTLAAYDAADPTIPYKADSVLIGNYAQTLLNSSFDSPEFVRHAALSNFFQDMPDQDITLGVLANADMSTFMASLSSTHPFRRVVVVSDPSGQNRVQPQVIATPRGQTVVSSITLSASWVTSYCDIAEAVTTPFVAFTDALSVVQGPVYILVDGQGLPLLPYIPANSEYCTTLASCTSELDEAEQLFGVRLNYHHNTFETVYNTSQFLRFCSAFRLAVSDLSTYEQCGIINGITGDSFIAWLISMSATEPFNYVPKNKQRYGARTWERLHATHAVDERTCSVYTRDEVALIGGNISTWSCLLIIEDPARCQATSGCTWRPMFASGRCVNTPQVTFDFLWIPETPITTTTTMSTTGTTGTVTSTTMTSTTRSTVTLTVQVPCDFSTLPSGFESASCNGLFGGQSCVVECLPPLFGNSEYFCDENGVFQGTPPTCVTRSCSFADPVPDVYSSANCQNITAGGVCFLTCPQGYEGLDTIFFCGPDWLLRGILPACTRIECYTGSLPSSDGANATDCLSGPDGQPLGLAQSCQVSCNRGFTGTSETMTCLESGLFSGNAVACERKQCTVAWTDASIGLDCRTGSTGSAAVHGDVCVAFCVQGFVGSSSELACVDGAFQGALPSCEPVICSWQGFQLASNVNNTGCNGIANQQTCTLSCFEGYTAVGNAQVTCQANNFFSEPQLTCSPKLCGDLSQVTGFDATVVGHTCNGATFSEICSTFCQEGYELSGVAPQVLCGAQLSTNQGFTAADGSAVAPPTCNPSLCTDPLDKLPRGASHDCTGIRTGQSCTVTAAAGYTAVPASSTLQCQSDGQITGEPMPVITPATCATASFGVGVGSTCQNKVIGAECWAYCEANYVGDARRYFCQVGGSGPELVAENLAISCSSAVATTVPPGRRLQAGCDANSVQAFGLNDAQYTHSCGTLGHDDVCISHCSLGWQLQGNPSVLVCDTGNLVGSSLPTCNPEPCTFNLPGSQVLHDCTGKRTLETCQGGCPVGYSGTSQSFTCLASGNFQGNDPTCTPLICNPPSLASQFSHDCTGIELGKRCTVDCAQGYQLSGGVGRLECSSDGSFTGAMPTCNRVPCDNTVPVDPAFAKTPCDGMSFQDQCQVTCYPSFQPNTTTLTCNSQGALVGTLPMCKATPCDGSNLQRPELLNTCDGVVVGQNCSVFCARGYEAAQGAGLEELACTLSGGQPTLLGSLPTCTASPCLEGLPLPSQRATNNCSQLFYQDTCIEQCIEGFTGAAPVFRCGSDGSAARSSDSFCTPAQCDSRVLGSLLLHTCADVTFGENCYAYCPPGYEADDLATRLQCLGASSNLPAVDPNQAQAVTLRGTLPQCIASRCIYNIPWEDRYIHNCSAAVTGRHCLVSCADGFVGPGPEVLVCQATGDLSGSYPTCQTTTRTSTRTSTTTTKEPILVTASGGYVVSWTLQNTTEAHPIVERVVEQSLLGLLNGSVTFPLAAVTIDVEVNGTEDAADILFDLQLFTPDGLTAINDLAQIFQSSQHALEVQAALRSLDFLSNASILEFRVTLTVASPENVTVDIAYAITNAPAADVPYDFPTTEVVASSAAGILVLCLCCSGIIYYIRFMRAGYRFSPPDSWNRNEATDSSGIVPDSKAKISGSEVALRRPSVEVQDVPHLSIQPMIMDQTKSPKPVDQEMEGFREDLDDLGINFESEEEEGSDNGLLWLEVDEMLTGQEKQELEDAGVVFDKGDKGQQDEDDLFGSESSEGEQPSVRLEVMDNAQHPPRIMTTGDRTALRDAGVRFDTEASGVSSKQQGDRRVLRDAGVKFDTEATNASSSQTGEQRALQDVGVMFDTEALELISESSDHFGL